MSNTTNTTWIVSYAVWIPSHSRMPIVKNCDGRSYRSEKYAMDRYNALVDYYAEQGYQIKEIEAKEGKPYFGVQLRKENGGVSGVIFVDRNPVWDPR